MNNHLLQLELSVKEYCALLEKRGALTSWHPTKEYYKVMPTYKVAECPFCNNGHDCLAMLDTYSILTYWSYSSHPGNMWGFNDLIIDPCPHFVTTEFFINLNGLLPTELDYFCNRSEVPFVNPHLLYNPGENENAVFGPDDTDPCVVMHALPICRIEEKEFEKQFIPRYTLFTLVYYARYRKEMKHHLMKDFKYQSMPMPEYDASDRDLWWNLDYWVKRNKLYWLDVHQKKLPIVVHPQQFPYNNIRGYKAIDVIYRNSKLSPTESHFFS